MSIFVCLCINLIFLTQIDAMSIQNALECFLLANDLSPQQQKDDDLAHNDIEDVEDATKPKVNIESVR
jgi:hypothetical protein